MQIVSRHGSGVQLRLATPDDVPALAALNDRYMRELFARPWNGTAAQLAADLFRDRVVSAAVAEHDGALVGFVAWSPAYDLHHCLRGGAIADLYVEPARRGRGVALQLLARACAEVAAAGGVYLVGTAVGDGPSRLYARAASTWPTVEAILGGRAFRTVAGLAGSSARDLVRCLPPVAWNREP
jgi:predicted N-acetyltransferase YhbS